MNREPFLKNASGNRVSEEVLSVSVLTRSGIVSSYTTGFCQTRQCSDVLLGSDSRIAPVLDVFAKSAKGGDLGL
jgi:hypothetical protein